MPTTSRNIRVDDDLWRRAQIAAAARGTDVSAIVRRALETYAARYERDHAEGE